MQLSNFTWRVGTAFGVKMPSWLNRVMPTAVVSVCSSVSAVVKSNPYTESTALFANTMQVAAAMFKTPYAAGFNQSMGAVTTIVGFWLAETR